MDDPYAQLENEYCPPLDSALLSAILSDFDLGTQQGIEEARSTLDTLKASAQDEEATGFDASGSGGALSGYPVDSHEQSATATSDFTGANSLSEDLSSLSLHSGSGKSEGDAARSVPEFDSLEQLDPVTKEAILFDMFPTVPEHNVSYLLKKCNGSFGKAMDELLNRVWFDEAGSNGEYQAQTKGIDAFADDGFSIHGRRRKGKKKRNAQSLFDEGQTGSSPLTSEDSLLPDTNVWQKAKSDIDFICARVPLPKTTVSSIYHENGASVSSAIRALTHPEQLPQDSSTSNDATIAAHSHELLQDFPTLSLTQTTALIRLTHPSTSSAHDLARALTRPSPASSSSSHLIPTYQPYTPDTEHNADHTLPPPTTAPTHTSTPHSPSAIAQARTHAFSSAARAHRLGRSDPLMRGAASYYATVGHSLAAQESLASAAAADALVAAQSPCPSEALDLHGVGVRDAVRIAEEGVRRWWEGLGDARIVGVDGSGGGGGRGRGGGLGGGFRVVTGVGRHSEGGRAKLGPAVGRALVRGGWRVEMGSGVVVVKGRARR